MARTGQLEAKTAPKLERATFENNRFGGSLNLGKLAAEERSMIGKMLDEKGFKERGPFFAAQGVDTTYEFSLPIESKALVTTEGGKNVFDLPKGANRLIILLVTETYSQKSGLHIWEPTADGMVSFDGNLRALSQMVGKLVLDNVESAINKGRDKLESERRTA